MGAAEPTKALLGSRAEKRLITVRDSNPEEPWPKCPSWAPPSRPTFNYRLPKRRAFFRMKRAKGRKKRNGGRRNRALSVKRNAFEMRSQGPSPERTKRNETRRLPRSSLFCFPGGRTKGREAHKSFCSRQSFLRRCWRKTSNFGSPLCYALKENQYVKRLGHSDRRRIAEKSTSERGRAAARDRKQGRSHSL